ncbi:hypothetical protein SAMN05216349_10973 [Oribacterium sp. KHPX15]|uniref:metallophosphoesterase n=1 Tax=Oribacterium sp. KHPX15 TaxID=1855342 RepID=UPI00089CECAE|nr:metallophosphoesterase [Oribacterium sp. KHPX15]SEA32879.1 hypothetical protein SAMN05216349_10973 [Oribacterium sp. KHPX15]
MFSIVINTILFILIFVIITITMSNWERNNPIVYRYVIQSGKLNKAHSFVYISDLHEKEFGENNEKLIEMIDELNPEFIIIGGDLIRCRKVSDSEKYKDKDKIDVSLKLLNDLKSKYKVYFSYGNHELRLMDKAGFNDCNETSKYDKYIQDISLERVTRLKQALEGIKVLDDETVSFSDFDLTGFTLPLDYYRPLFMRTKEMLTEEDISLHISKPDKDKFNIILLHTPMYYKEMIDYGADLVLSGHYHGGTVRLPGLGALMTPQYQFFVKECAGEFKYKTGKLIATRGLGTHSINIRINDRPEISFITIEP